MAGKFTQVSQKINNTPPNVHLAQAALIEQRDNVTDHDNDVYWIYDDS